MDLDKVRKIFLGRNRQRGLFMCWALISLGVVIAVVGLMTFYSADAADVTFNSSTSNSTTMNNLIALLKDPNNTKITFSGGSYTVPSGDWELASAGQGVTIVGRFVVGNGRTLTIGKDSSETLIIDANQSGTAVTVSSGGTLNLRGGTIRNGRATEGGGVNITGGTFNMYGGYVSYNTATTGNGGGVYVNETANSTFNMFGGTISYNSASGKTSDGGGVSVAPRGTATLYAGYLYNNKCGQHGGAVGTGWPESGRKSATIIINPVIAGNEAAEQGGGLYGCPEGTVANIENNRTAIFENKTLGSSSASRNSQDVRVEPPSTGNNRFVVPTYMLNGVGYGWANAGNTVNTFNGIKKYPISGVSYPFDISCPESEVLDIIKKLEAEFTDGRVFIVNNKAGHVAKDGSGGGVGGNGSWVVLGEDKPTTSSGKGSLTLKKLVSGGTETDIDDVFTFTVNLSGMSGYPRTVTLKNGDSITFTDVPANTVFEIEEASYAEYNLAWSGDGTVVAGKVTGTIVADKHAGVTAINIRKPTEPGTLIVKKTAEKYDAGTPTSLDLDTEFFLFRLTGPGGAAVYLRTEDVSPAGAVTDAAKGEFRLKHGENVTISGLSPGNYVVLEYSLEYSASDFELVDFTTTYKVDDGLWQNGNAANIVPIESGGETVVEFLNVEIPPPQEDEAEITVKGLKSVKGASAPTGTVFIFTLTQVKNAAGVAYDGVGSPITRTVSVKTDKTGEGSYEFVFPRISHLKLGEAPYFFKIAETTEGDSAGWSSSPDYRIVEVTVDEDPVDSTKLIASQTIVYDSANPTFTNTYEPAVTPGTGSLRLKKVVDGPDNDSNKDFTFTVTFDKSVTYQGSPFTTGTVLLHHDETVVFTGIPIGTKYTIIEGDYSEDRYSSDQPGDKVEDTIDDAREYTVTFINTYSPPTGGGGGGSGSGGGNPTPPTPSLSPSPSPSATPSESPPPSPDDEPPDDEPPDDEPPPYVQPDEPPPFEPEPAEPAPEIPPIPVTLGNTLVPSGDVFIEFDGDVPLGEWRWDPDEEMWIFDPYPPLGDMPQTGTTESLGLLFLLSGFALIGVGVVLVCTGSYSHSRVSGIHTPRAK